MKLNRNTLQKYPKIGLLISVLIVIPVGLSYGFFPEFILQEAPINNNLDSFNKAVMGIYLVFGLYWLLAIIQSKFLKVALTLNMLFMFGLFFGRMVSLFAMGLPSNLFIVGTIGELFLAVYSFIQLQESKK
ncbi:MAG: hypothetical protein ACI9XR_001203 [Flavobacterium sp.]|jgi:hypothetical protein